MICGASYNVFNGEEHLLHSLSCVRPFLDHVNIIVQYVSNTGAKCSEELHDIIRAAQHDRLVDVVIEYDPDFSIASKLNELAKRSIGLNVAQNHSVTHFMTMDCDEYYIPSEFSYAKEFIRQNDIKASAVPTYLHLKRPIWRSLEPDQTCCSFLTAINQNSRLILNSPYPVLVDPKRRLHGEEPHFHFFDAEKIAMRHMNMVRLNMNSKLENSVNSSNTTFMNEVSRAYEMWEFGKSLYFPRKPPMEIIQVPDIFHIDHIFT